MTEGLAIAVSVIETTVLHGALWLTRDHFRKLRAAHFIERFNESNSVDRRAEVDSWLASGDNDARLRALHDDPKLAAIVKSFANYFQELGQSFSQGHLDTKYAVKSFDYLVPHYWSCLEFWIQERRREDPNLYSEFERLARTLK